MMTELELVYTSNLYWLLNTDMQLLIDAHE